ncbi:MAG: FixH family protein [Candidatus Bostrichicola ureolyticus]|nr:MAG: FixH family protein [Candidatus Bostrichicola ureolyticus]
MENYLKEKKLFGINNFLIICVLISFIIFIIYIAFFKSNITSELISDNYYEEEMKYQEIIDECKNTANLSQKINIKTISNGIKICFPEIFNFKNTKGNIILLRPSNKKLDSYQLLKLNSQRETLIPANILKTGFYQLILRWNSNGKKYCLKTYIKWNPN